MVPPNLLQPAGRSPSTSSKSPFTSIPPNATRAGRGVALAVEDGAAVGVCVDVAVRVAVDVLVGLGVLVAVAVRVGEGVRVALADAAPALVATAVAVLVAAGLPGVVAVAAGVCVAIGVGVLVGGAGVGVGAGADSCIEAASTSAAPVPAAGVKSRANTAYAVPVGATAETASDSYAAPTLRLVTPPPTTTESPASRNDSRRTAPICGSPATCTSRAYVPPSSAAGVCQMRTVPEGQSSRSAVPDTELPDCVTVALDVMFQPVGLPPLQLSKPPFESSSPALAAGLVTAKAATAIANPQSAMRSDGLGTAAMLQRVRSRHKRGGFYSAHNPVMS